MKDKSSDPLLTDRGTGQLLPRLPEVIGTAHALAQRRVRAAGQPSPLLPRADATPPAEVTSWGLGS